MGTESQFSIWITGLVPGLGQGPQSAEAPEYFAHIGELFADMLVSDILSPGTIETITNKMLYAEMTSSFPPTKVVRESNRDYGNVWARLHSPVVEARARDIMYLMLHNKLPVVERLFRIRLRPDPYCKSCIGAELGM